MLRPKKKGKPGVKENGRAIKESRLVVNATRPADKTGARMELPGVHTGPLACIDHCR
ncbi:MAG: hypothetical protein JXB30_08780 [Anaerolineae bacterium]|nr:hypothetical protein [Anaerolineae bacterium]